MVALPRDQSIYPSAQRLNNSRYHVRLGNASASTRRYNLFSGKFPRVFLVTTGNELRRNELLGTYSL